jgi:hypothetical protein
VLSFTLPARVTEPEALLKTAISLITLVCALTVPASAYADPFSFSNGTPDGRMGMASRPGSSGVTEIEAADDFILNSTTSLTSASFWGLLPSTGSILGVDVEIYRVFPQDSDTTRTPAVPTRANSPSDVVFDARDSATNLTFTSSVLSNSFSVANSVVNGINKFPNQTTGGEGPASGKEVEIDVNFTLPIDLGAGHYFFVPQVLLSNGTFLWLSSARPNPALTPDLQAWIRNGNLDPDWLRVGTDIVGGSPAPTFNGAFSLGGSTASSTPEPSSWVLLLTGSAAFLRKLRPR